jgi:hypothetical protein
MEGSFAQATRFGLKRARWRGQWRVQIQDYLIAIVQNIELLIAHARPKPRAALAVLNFTKQIVTGAGELTLWLLSASSGGRYVRVPASL